MGYDFYFSSLEEQIATPTGKNIEEKSRKVSNTKCSHCSVNAILLCNFCVTCPVLLCPRWAKLFFSVFGNTLRGWDL